MKKFFELSVTSRKSVKANTPFSVEAYTGADEKVGQLDIKLADSETFGGIFAKYTPTDIAQSSRISLLKISGNDENKIRKTLKMLSSAVNKSLEKREISDASDFLTNLIIMNCIVPETNTILIPPLGFEKFTSEFICNFVNSVSNDFTADDWLGIEVKFSSEIVGKISEVADKQKKKTVDELEQLLKELEQERAKATATAKKDEIDSLISELNDLLDLF